MLLLAALACSSAPQPEPPYFDDVPAYPGARKLCSWTREVTDGDLTTRVYGTVDRPAEVQEWYRANHGSAILQPSGDLLFVRGTKDSVLTIGAASESLGAECDGRFKGERTGLVIEQPERRR